MSEFVELFMDQNATFTNIINLTDDVTNTPINVANYTVTSQPQNLPMMTESVNDF